MVRGCVPLFEPTPRRPRKICFVSGTQADYRLLKPLIFSLRGRSDLAIQLIVSGTHLARSHGETWRRIEADGLVIDARAETVLDADTPSGVCTTLGLGLMRFGDILERLSPHLIVVMGARPEAVSAALAASVSGIKVAHIVEGDGLSAPGQDKSRRLITTLSHFHFASTATDRLQLVQDGADVARVFEVGSLRVERVLKIPLLDRQSTLRRFDLTESARYLLVAFDPAAGDPLLPQGQRAPLDAALARFPHVSKIVTGSREDRTSDDRLASDAANSENRMRYVGALGASLYFSAVRWAEAVVGNASSGIVEVPSLAVPSVTIGSRQAGRAFGDGVIACDPHEDAIVAAIEQAVSAAGRSRAARSENPYEKAGTTEAIGDCLAGMRLDEPTMPGLVNGSRDATAEAATRLLDGPQKAIRWRAAGAPDG